jgi:transposase
LCGRISTPQGPERNGGQVAQALGRSRGGFSTKIHAGCLDEQTSVAFELTSGAHHDAPAFEIVFEHCPVMPQLESVVMDKAYDSDHIRQHLQEQEMRPAIPPKQNRKQSLAYDAEQYKLREKVERFFNTMKHCRRLATRDEKLSQTFLALIHLVALWMMVR